MFVASSAERERDPRPWRVVHWGGIPEGQDQRTVPPLSAGPLLPHPADDEEALMRKIFVKRERDRSRSLGTVTGCVSPGPQV